VIIIGEKINGTIPKVRTAIEERNADWIRMLALEQVEAGAHYLDVCASTEPEIEVETLLWLMEIIQEVVDVPLCIDSPNPHTIEAVFKYARKPGIINSVSSEGEKCEIIFPLIEGTSWQVIALTCDNEGIPKSVQKRVDIACSLVEKAVQYGITPDRIHLDPLVIALPTSSEAVINFVGTIKQIKDLYPTIKVTSGLSNISFGMPLRKAVNQIFFAIASFSGMDSAIMDPLSRELMTTLLAVEAFKGNDRHCRNFNNAYRNGVIGPFKDSR